MDQRGFAYIALLIALAVAGTLLAATGVVWATAQQRERERQLLFVGGEFRSAIARYAEQDPGSGSRYPMRLEDLLRDPRTPGMLRHLRRIYPDPLTGSTEWGLLKGSNGEIYGVYSRSEAPPLKRANFDPEDSRLEGRTKYSEWVFTPLRTVARTPEQKAAARAFGRGAPPRH